MPDCWPSSRRKLGWTSNGLKLGAEAAKAELRIMKEWIADSVERQEIPCRARNDNLRESGILRGGNPSKRTAGKL